MNILASSRNKPGTERHGDNRVRKTPGARPSLNILHRLRQQSQASRHPTDRGERRDVNARHRFSSDLLWAGVVAGLLLLVAASAVLRGELT
jgi:hypothetical protein